MIPSATALMSEPSRDSPNARALSRNSRDVLEEEEGAEEDDEEKAETNIYIYIWLPVISSGYKPEPPPPRWSSCPFCSNINFSSCLFCSGISTVVHFVCSFVCLFVCSLQLVACISFRYVLNGNNTGKSVMINR